LSEQEHLLLRVVHNIVLDGWSSGIFDSELCIAYNAFLTGHEPELPELPIQYADYAAWQREWLRGEVLEEQLAYWKSRLSDVSTLELPTDRPRPTVASDRGAHLTFELPAPLTGALKALGQREGATLFMTLLAAFQVLLHRYSGQEDIAVGAPIAGRTHRETEGLIGFFVNTLVLRTDASGDPAFRELLARVRENALAAYAHQDLPFEKLVEELAPARDLSRNPLFQVMFALQNAPGATLALEGLEVSRQPLEGHTAKFDLYLAVREAPSGLRMSWEFSTDLFDASTIERMARHFGRLLEAIVADPEQRIGELPLLDAAERRQLLVEWNNTEADYPRDRCIHELFEAQSARTPDAVAVVFEERQLTYAELNARASELAQHLMILGVGPEVLVGICLERSLESIVGMLGILKAGGAYVPLDPGYPREHLAFMLHDTQAPVLLTREGLLGQLPQYEGRILCLDRDWPQISAHNQDGDLHIRMAARPEPEVNGAYVIYTSGSTGLPKGVVGLHQGIVNRLSWMWKDIPFDPGEVFCQKTSLTFVDSVCEIFGPLLQGFPLVVVSDACVKDPRRLVEILSTRHVTRIVVVPSLLRALLETYDDLGDRLPRLTLWVTSGEALSPELLRPFRKQLPHSRLLNLYGSSEVAADVTCYDTAATRSHSSVPIGRPIANTRVYILDRHGEPVPVGVPGELYVAGAGLARGYLNRPELTAEKFLPDPFSAVPGARLYRTGDRARYRPDGNIEYLGRIDDQVKIRGFRVELGEVEAALAEHPAVCQAVVLARDDALGDKRLVAYVVLDTDRSLDQSTVRTELRSRLPDYMIPSHFITLPALPLTPHGKCDRMALTKMEGVVLAVGTEYVAPRNELEYQLTAIWQKVLDQERVGIHDNFFDLGGHSLLAARLAVEIEKLLHRKLPIAILFQSPTVESLARWLTEENWAPQWSSLVPLQPLGSRPPFFLMHGWGGDMYGSLGLARLLPRDQPTYGLQAVGLDGKSARHTNVEDMAAHYVQEIRAFQPAGPYYLGGYSIGGVIAFEVAQQLHRLGERVALLALLDGAPIGALPWTVYGRVVGSHIRSRWLMHLRRWWEMPSHDRLDYLQGRWAALQFWVARNRSKPAAVTVPPPVDSRPPQVPGFADYYVALVSTYRFHRYPGSADVFVSDDTKPHWVSSWRHLVRGEVSFHPVPGRHLQILSPDHVPALAKSLATVLHRTQEKERAPHSRSGQGAALAFGSGCHSAALRPVNDSEENR
jgi:amino acid adenylation domain-containing protein